MKSTFVFLFWLLLSPLLALSQHHKIEKTAFDLVKVQDYLNGCPMVDYLDSIKSKNANLPFYKGICVFHTDNKAGSLKYFLQAKTFGLKDHELPFYLGRAFHFNLLFDSATYYYTSYLKTLDTIHHHKHLIHRYKEIQRYLHNCEIGKQMIADSLEVKIEHLTSKVNSQFADYSPVLSADETVLLFTSRRTNSTGGELADDGKYYEDIYMSLKDSTGNWSTPVHLSDSINTPGHDACVGLSADGQKLYIYRSWKHHDKSGDLFVSQLKGHNWSKPVKLTDGINSNSWESSISMSANEEQIFFASDRKGGLGGNDLYVMRKKADGKYSKPQNLGPTVNTPFDDDSPLIHTDGKTLFFSSKGHEGMGGFDVFVTTYNDKDSTWSKPMNVGYPVSTPGDDIYFAYTADGSKGYFSSFRSDSYGEKDLYIIHRPDDSPSLLVFKGFIKDSGSDKPIAATITLTNSETGKIENVFNSNAVTGKYVVVLEFGKKYEVTVESEGYMYKSEPLHVPEKSSNIFQYVRNFFLDLIKKPNDITLVAKKQKELESPGDTLTALDKKSKKTEPEEDLREHAVNYTHAAYANNKTKRNKELFLEDSGFIEKRTITYNKAFLKAESNNLYTMNISMEKLSLGSKFVLRNILFDFDKAILKDDSKKELDRLFGLLEKNKNVILEIAGHTDNRGGLEYNIGLSKRRAQSVVDYLVTKGIESKRLQSAGYGETVPVAPNTTATGRHFNRRTEFEVLDTTFHYLSHPIRYNHTSNTDNIWRELPMKLYFDRNEASTNSPFSQQRLNDVSFFLKQNPELKIAIVANADAVLEKNIQNLMKMRASNSKEQLVKKGINSARVTIISEQDLPQYLTPINDDRGGINRSVEFYIMN